MKMGVFMSTKNQAERIEIVPLAHKEQEEFLCRCDKLYFSLLQKNTSLNSLLEKNLTNLK